VSGFVLVTKEGSRKTKELDENTSENPGVFQSVAQECRQDC
jgi:hypothetical protein